MRIEDVEFEIVLGGKPGEEPADLLYMCHSVALARMARREDFDPDEEYGRYDKFSRRSDWMSWRARLLYGAGLVLCPIFEPVKHRNYREYSERMAAARMTYRGIAADSRLRFEFAKRVESIIEIGSFDSLDKAAGSGLPERLALNSESRGGTFA